MKILIYVPQFCIYSAIAGINDIFWIANNIIKSKNLLNLKNLSEINEFKVELVSIDGNPVVNAQNKMIDVDLSIEEAINSDLIIVPGMMLSDEQTPIMPSEYKAVLEWLQNENIKKTIICGVCAGTFVLGDAGLLNRKNYATTWWLYHTFQKRFPNGKLSWGKTFEKDKNIITTGGPLSWIELVLYIISQFAGPEVAKATSDLAVAGAQPVSQQIYVPEGFTSSVDPLLMKIEEFVKYTNPNISLEELAEKLNISERTLYRKVKKLTNESPKDLITRFKIEKACYLLENNNLSIKTIAQNCGYSEDTAFRKAFTKILNMNPLEYRKYIKNRV